MPKLYKISVLKYFNTKYKCFNSNWIILRKLSKLLDRKMTIITYDIILFQNDIFERHDYEKKKTCLTFWEFKKKIESIHEWRANVLICDLFWS